MSQLRKISEQELKVILDKHGKWLRNEEGGEKADLSYADLSYANLRCANLRYADLSSANLIFADLSYADLSYANLNNADLNCANFSSVDLRSVNLITFHFQQHQAFYTLDGTLRIGCTVMPISEWELGFEEIGKSNGYSAKQITAYGAFIKLCADNFRSKK